MSFFVAIELHLLMLLLHYKCVLYETRILKIIALNQRIVHFSNPNHQTNRLLKLSSNIISYNMNKAFTLHIG